MKFINKISIFYINFVLLSFVSLTKVRIESEDSSSSEMYSEIVLDGPSKNKFKGQVTFEKQGKGLIIKSINGEQNDKLLKLVADKLASDTYLIDYRLMRSCAFPVKFSGEMNKNIKLAFSPKSLENKNKNEKFDFNLEIFNFINFFPKVEKTEIAIQNEIKTQCEKRKNTIIQYKSLLMNDFNEYQEIMKQRKQIKSRLNSAKKNTEVFNTNFQDINNQIAQINELKNSYEKQRQNLEILMKGSNKLLKKEKEDLSGITNNNNDIQNKLKENTIQLKKLSEKDNDLKKSYEKLIRHEKNNDEELNNLNKKKSVIEEKISSISRNKLSDEYEIKYTNSTQKEIALLMEETKNQIQKFKTSQIIIQNKTVEIVKSKDVLEENIRKNKESILNVDDQINELILKKTKLEEEVKDHYNSIKSKEDELSSIDIENQQLSSNIKRLEDKLKSSRLNLDNIRERNSYLSKHENKFRNRLIRLNSTRNNFTVEINNTKKKKATILIKIKESKVLIESNNNEINNLNNVKFSLEKMLSDNNLEIKEKESNVKNLENEIMNYEKDIENIDKTISSFSENKSNVEKILDDLNKKLSPYKQDNQKFSKLNTLTEEKLSKVRTRIRSSLDQLKKNVPATKIIMDIIDDEFINSDEDFEKRKLEKLVQKIIV